jgi:hypothetical protein
MAARTVPTMPSFLAGQKLTATLLNQVGSYVTFWTSPPMFRMIQTVSQSIPNTTTTQVTMDSVTGGQGWDTDSGRSGSTPYSYTIPVGMGGRWQFSWGVAWPFNATGSRVAILERNGTPSVGSTDDVAANNDFTDEAMTATVLVNAGDVMSVWAYQNSGGALSLAVGTQFASFFEGRFVSLGSP